MVIRVYCIVARSTEILDLLETKILNIFDYKVAPSI